VDNQEPARIPRMPGPTLSLRFDDSVLQLTHDNTTVRLFSEAYAHLNHAYFGPTHDAPGGVYSFKARLVERLRAEWFPTTITRYPTDRDVDAYIAQLDRDFDRAVKNPTA
jgi:hypothetical protein